MVTLPSADAKPAEWMVAMHEAGLNVMPLCKGGKRPLLGAWMDLQFMPADAEQVAEWAKRWPDCNYAVICGQASGIIVIDADSEISAGWVRPLAEWSFIVRTSRGAHFYCRHPLQGEIACAKPVDGVDVKADGGYVVGPGSVHPTGAVYEVEAGRSDLTAIPVWTDGLLASLPGVGERSWRAPVRIDESVASRYRRDLGSFAEYVALCSRATVAFLLGQYAGSIGERNVRLFRASCDLHGNGCPLHMAYDYLISGAGPRDQREVKEFDRTIRSAYSRPRLPARAVMAAKGGEAS